MRWVCYLKSRWVCKFFYNFQEATYRKEYILRKVIDKIDASEIFKKRLLTYLIRKVGHFYFHLSLRWGNDGGGEYNQGWAGLRINGSGLNDYGDPRARGRFQLYK
mgnify:CR=1 FL=1